jgi:G3E family GTPase
VLNFSLNKTFDYYCWLSQSEQGNIAVLVNEFWKVEIDGEFLRDFHIGDEDKDSDTNILKLTNCFTPFSE